MGVLVITPLAGGGSSEGFGFVGRVILKENICKKIIDGLRVNGAFKIDFS